MKKYIFIGLICLCMILGITLIINNKNESKNDNENNNKSTIDSEVDSRLEILETRLSENNITLKNRKEIYSEAINEKGYSFELNGENIEIYPVDQFKMDNIIVSDFNNNEVIVKTLDGDEIAGIYINELLILNCVKNKYKILNLSY